MPQYTPPLRDMQFVMHEVLNVVDELKMLPAHADIDADTINAVLEEGGKFASQVIVAAEPERRRRRLHARQDHPRGDGARGLQGGLRAVRRRRLAGAERATRRTAARACRTCVNQCFYEMLNSANQAWTMYPGLSHGAYECLHAHGTDEQKALYLPKLTSGQWTGTMCLTEPHCGTDLGLLRTKAEPQPDGSYRITGTKIFISAGEHDLAENIVHLVLARLPDAPAGTKGISLFVVPKFNVNADGTLGSAQRHLLRRPRAQDGHPRQRHLRRSFSTAPSARWSASRTRAWRRCS